jgi:hypothetical protein
MSDLIEYLKTGKAETIEPKCEGGYLIPQYIYNPRPGFTGWLYRLLKDDRGWIEINLYQMIIDGIEKATK